MSELKRKGKWLEYTLPKSENGTTVEKAIKEGMHISGRMIQKLTRKNGIQLNGKKSHLSVTVKAGDRIQVSIFEKEDYGVEPEPMPLDILFEDDHLMIVNKPVGVAVHPTEPGQKGTLAHGIAFYYQANGWEIKVRHIHRLDKDTSGVLMIAKHSLAQAILDEELRDRKIKRIYLAIASGVFEHKSGTIHEPIGRDRHHPTRRRVSHGGDDASTHYRVLEQYTKGALLELELETGRTHQIRVHLSHIGHPIYGDSLYGGPKYGINRQALHGYKITFTHPFTKEILKIESDLPQDMKQLIEKIK